MKKKSDLKIPFVWEERRPVLLERFLYVPALYEGHEAWERVPWSDPSIFGNDKPVVLEYCSGNGQWVSLRAQQNPDLNWVALDIRFDRSRKTWTRLHRENIPNLFVMCGEALTLTQHYIPKNSLSEIFVNFPDPWPKLRHAKHRLIQAPFLKEVAGVVKPGAHVTFVTDDEVYRDQMIRELSLCRDWCPRLPLPHYCLDWSDYGNSFFFDLWKKKGKNIYFIPFERSLCT